MATHKSQQKKLKGPDQFQVAAAGWLDWAMGHTKTIALLSIPIVGLILGVLVWQSTQQSEASGRQAELGKIQIEFERELTQASDLRDSVQKKIDEIDKKIADAKKKDADATPDPKLVAEKEAFTKQRDEIEPSHEGSRTKFESFFAKYPAQPEGWMAAMTAARLHLQDEKLQEARGLLEKLLEVSKDERFYQLHGRMMLVGILEDFGEFDKGLEHAAVMEKHAAKDMQPQIPLVKGRLQVLKKAEEDARQTFKKLIDDHGATPEAQKARSIQALLN